MTPRKNKKNDDRFLNEMFPSLWRIISSLPAWIWSYVVGVIMGVGFTLLILFSMKAAPQQLPKSQFSVQGYSGNYAFDGRTHQPSWLLETLSPDTLSMVDRSQLKYVTDSEIPEIIQPQISDYQDSGFEIGQLLSNPGLPNMSYSLSTASPQDPKFNGYWLKMDDYLRNKVINLKDRVVTITGPMYLPEEKDDKKYVSYQVIGQNNVAVPTHFFKAVFYVFRNKSKLEPQEKASKKEPDSQSDYYSTINDNMKIMVEAYIVPNKGIQENTSIQTFRTTIPDLEKKSGIVFPKDLSSYFLVPNLQPPS